MTDTQARHTPGPWTAGAFPKPNGADITIEARTPVHNNPIYVARVYNEGVLASSSPEREANARLIAAAPDLLNALVALWTSVMDEECPWCDDVSWHGTGHGCQMADTVERAIEQATGKAS